MDSRLAATAARSAEVASCCNLVYGHPLAEALVGASFHPGGLDRTRQLLQAAGLPPGSRILDVGCGLGASARLAVTEFGLVVDALDVGEGVLLQAQQRSAGFDIQWRTGDVAHLPLSDATYDAVLAECVLAAAPREAAMAEIARVLQPGGRLLISDVQVSGDPIAHLEPGGVLGTALCVGSAWLPGEFEQRAEAAAFEVVRRWDRRDDVSALIDRIEGRLTIARSLLPRPSGDVDVTASLAMPDRETVEAVTAELRAAVEDGRLGYFAAIARR